MVYSKIICDVSNIFYKNYFTHKDLKTVVEGQEIETGGIYGFIKSLQKIQREYATPETDFFLLFDNMSSKDSARRDLDPDYKINRTKYNPSFYRAIDYLQLILLNYSEKFHTVLVEGYEADDLLPCVLSSFDKYDKVLVVSDDLDYARCLSENVVILQKGQIFDMASFEQEYGFAPTKEKVVMMKTLRGDKSDCIAPGLPGIRKEKLLYLINKYPNIYDLLRDAPTEVETIGQKYVDLLRENNSRLILNFQLVDFIGISFEYMKEFIRDGSFNPQILRVLYKVLGFRISDLDKRLMEHFPEKPAEDVFFTFDKIKRKEY